jgi:hypothetical protein
MAYRDGQDGSHFGCYYYCYSRGSLSTSLA